MGAVPSGRASYTAPSDVMADLPPNDQVNKEIIRTDCGTRILWRCPHFRGHCVMYKLSCVSQDLEMCPY